MKPTKQTSQSKPKRGKEPVEIDQSKATPLTPDQLEKLKSAPPGARLTMCKGQQIPSGWVIVAEGTSINCPGSWPNTWEIKQPGQSEVVCKVSPLPTNYVVVGEGTSINCPGNWPNTWTIQRV